MIKLMYFRTNILLVRYFMWAPILADILVRISILAIMHYYFGAVAFCMPSDYTDEEIQSMHEAIEANRKPIIASGIAEADGWKPTIEAYNVTGILPEYQSSKLIPHDCDGNLTVSDETDSESSANAPAESILDTNDKRVVEIYNIYNTVFDYIEQNIPNIDPMNSVGFYQIKTIAYSVVNQDLTLHDWLTLDGGDEVNIRLNMIHKLIYNNSVPLNREILLHIGANIIIQYNVATTDMPNMLPITLVANTEIYTSIYNSLK